MPKKAETKKVKSKVVKPKTTSLLREKMAEKSTQRVAEVSTTLKRPSLPNISPKKSFILFVIVLLALVLYLTKDRYIAAIVNGQPITRYELRTELEKQSGQQALENLITKKLILQEAKKQKISVSQTELDGKIAEIEEELKAQNQTFDQVLALQGLNRREVEEQIKLQLLVEKLVGSNVEVTEEEVSAYLEENKEFLPEDADEAELSGMVSDQLKQQKVNSQIQEWITKLQADSTIQNYLFPKTN